MFAGGQRPTPGADTNAGVGSRPRPRSPVITATRDRRHCHVWQSGVVYVDEQGSTFFSNLFAAVTDAARIPELASLAMPVHLIWGARDPNQNLNIARALHQEIPHSTLTVLPNAHHNAMLDDPAAFAAAIKETTR